MRVSVEFSPRLRRLTFAVPDKVPRSAFPPSARSLVMEPEFISRFLMTSHICEAPCASMDVRSTTCTGDGASRGLPRKYEPVTTTSSTSLSLVLAPPPCASADPQNIPDMTPRSSALFLKPGQLDMVHFPLRLLLLVKQPVSHPASDTHC